MKGAFYLALAIVAETFGSTMLKYSNGFTILFPSIGVAIGYLISFISLSLALKSIPLSSAYATWSGVGTALTAILGVILFNEHMSLMKVLALMLVIIGIVILNTSQSTEKQTSI